VESYNGKISQMQVLQLILLNNLEITEISSSGKKYNQAVKINKFIQDYEKFLKENFDPVRAEKEKAYLYSDLKHYGIPSKDKKDFLKRYKSEIKSLSKKQALSLVKLLWSKSSFEEKGAALHVLELHEDKLNISDMPLIEMMMRESKGWALLDSLIIPLMPGLLEKDKRIYKYLKKWIRDNNFWVRRSALLAQLLLFRKGAGGKRELFFDMAVSQFDESWIDNIYKGAEEKKRAKFFMRKAIGWSLREMSQKNPKTVYDFLKKNKDKMSGLSFREGSRKLPEFLKEKLSG